jgi:hypothetical protein
LHEVMNGHQNGHQNCGTGPIVVLVT